MYNSSVLLLCYSVETDTFKYIWLLFLNTMVDYYCPFCGMEAYRGHRDYKCDNEDCENFEQPVFTLEGKPLNPPSSAEAAEV